VLATSVVLFAVVGWALPYFAERATISAQDQLSRGQVEAAEADARRAASLDPLSIDPLLTLADVQAQQGDPDAAAATLQRAVQLQPHNYRPYYQMGTLFFESFHDEAAARAWYLRALELNPMHPGLRSALEGL
jgi:tetratricopeptide (TPR) repeat protein